MPIHAPLILRRQLTTRLNKLLRWLADRPLQERAPPAALREKPVISHAQTKFRRSVVYTKYVLVENQAEAIEATKDGLILAVIGSKSKPKQLMFVCPCGCNELLRVNLSPAIGPAWRIRFNNADTISLYPSVDLDTGCRAHFIVRNNKALVI